MLSAETGHSRTEALASRTIRGMNAEWLNVWWLLVPLAYLGGTFPSALLVGRLAGHDPSREGSGNPGASNVYRLAGKFPGAIVLMLDVAKAVVPTVLGFALDGRPLGIICGAAAVLGHVFPVSRGLRGGKGVATFGGLTIGAWPIVGAIALIVFVVVTRVTKRASVGSLVGVGITTVGVWLTRPLWELLVCAALAVIIVLRHQSNIRRLIRNEEILVRG